VNSKTLIILGMHRSGTSLVAQWLHKSGINLGENLMDGNASNQDGHFEDMDFHDLHESILNENNIPYGALKALPEKIHVSETHRNLAKKIIKERQEKFSQWGWKDPRTCLFIPLYKSLLPDAHYIVVLRDKSSVVSSLINREMGSKIRRIKRRYYRKPIALRKIGLFPKPDRKILSVEQQIKSSKVFDFTNAWSDYNTRIMCDLADVNPAKIKLIEFNNLQDSCRDAQDWLLNCSFKVKKNSINDFFKPRLITSIKNNELFGADERMLLQQLRSMSCQRD
jgi:hypothetical protein